MNNIINSISKVFKGAWSAFAKYPMVIGNALGFSLVTLIRIHLDWPMQEALNFLFNCLHLSLAFGAIFSLMAITYVQVKMESKKNFILANILGIGVTLLSLILLYFFGGIYNDYSYNRYMTVSNVAAARILALTFVSFMYFIVLGGQDKDSDFSKSFFMTHKAFFIASLYGLVMFLGASAVAGSVQALLYRDMSSKVYAYIGTISGFLAFSIFVGYFPDFRKDSDDSQRQIAYHQPKFIEILLEYILTPLMIALTLVLVLWSIKTIFSGMNVAFFRLSATAASYAIGGIWLHILLTHYDLGIAKFYKRIYSFAAIFILAFEAWAIIIQLSKFGIKTAEYNFILLWIITLSAALLLLLKKDKAHHIIVLITCILAIVSVLPGLGYDFLPPRLQKARLERVLISENILLNETIVPKNEDLDRDTKEYITGAVIFLGNSENASLPPWFNKKWSNSYDFKNDLGFDQTFPEDDYDYPGDYSRTALYLSDSAFSIKAYDWVIASQYNYREKNTEPTFAGSRGDYKVYWDYGTNTGIPILKIFLNDKLIVEDDLSDFLDIMVNKYPLLGYQDYNLPVEEISFVREIDEIEYMIVFSEVSISLYPESDNIDYWITPYGVYLIEK